MKKKDDDDLPMVDKIIAFMAFVSFYSWCIITLAYMLFKVVFESLR